MWKVIYQNIEVDKIVTLLNLFFSVIFSVYNVHCVYVEKEKIVRNESHRLNRGGCWIRLTDPEQVNPEINHFA